MMSDVNSLDGVDSNELTTLHVGDDLATVTAQYLPDTIVLTVAGEIDMMTAPALERAVQQALVARPAVLVIDLTGVEFLSSAGIAVLMHAHGNDVNAALRIVATNRVVLRPVELIGLIGDLAIYPTVSAAVGR